MSVRQRLSILLLAAGVGAGQARAQGPVANEEDPALRALVEEALAKNPEVIAAQESVAAARARPAQARSLPDPMLSVAYTNDNWSPTLGTRDMTTLAFMWGQQLPYPGKRRLRGHIAGREADQVAQQLDRVKLGVAAAVKRAYYGLVLARDLLGLIGEQEEIWNQIEGVARTRYVVGQGAQQEVLRAQIEVTRVEQLRAEQEVEAEIRVAELNRLLDRPATSPIETMAGLRLRPLREKPDSVVERVAAISPEIRSAGVRVETAGLEVDLARRQFKPDFSVQAGYMNRGGLDPMWQAGIGVSLPVHRRRLSSGVAEAEAQRRAGERRLESVRLQLRFRTQERLAQLKATERIAILYGEGIVPQDRMSVDAALANYQTGRVPFITVLEALTTLYKDRATHVGLLANHERIRASLEEASLEETSGMTPAGGAAMAEGGGSLTMPGAGGGSAGMGGSGSMSNR